MAKSEWMLTVHDCRDEVQEKINNSSYGEACEIIGDTAQLKLLNHIDKKYRCGIKEDMACGYIMIPPEEFNLMKSQLQEATDGE